MDKLYILDASGYLYRSYFAIRQMTNAKGESTNALFGFLRSLLKLLKDFQPTHLVAVFDGPNSISERTNLFADYKAHRKEMPKDLLYQILWAQQICPLMGISKLVIEGVEADDTIGSIAQWASAQGTEVYLCTSDKDMCQLVTEKIRILNTYKENQILGPMEVEKQFGVRPDQMIDFLTMTGDASDNVPGLTGFGPKTAADLLKKFQTLDYLLLHPLEVAGERKQQALIQEKEKALLSRQLVSIKTDVDFPKNSDFFTIKPHQLVLLKDFYIQMNFSSLLRELESLYLNQTSALPPIEEEVQYKLVDDINQLQELIVYLSQQKSICLDTETTGLDPLQSELVGIGLGVEPKKAWYIPVNGRMGLEQVMIHLKPLFENPSIGFYGHHLKYDAHILQNYGVTLNHICFDTLLASYLLNSHSRQHSLDQLALDFFGKVKTPIERLIGKGKKQKNMRDVPLEDVAAYCCEDVDYTIRLHETLSKQIEERKLNALLTDLELPLLPVLSRMERNGIFVDIEYLKQLGKEINKNLEEVSNVIYDMAGESFNLNSPKQLSHILFNKLRIYPRKRNATGASTSAEVLESLKEEYPIASKLLEYRALEKLRSTYIETLIQDVNPHTHRIHCQFNQSVTATGRLSCQDPNLQNIPVRTEMGRKIREAFCPQHEGWSFLAADYSQIELRILAHLSEDPMLIHAFEANEDIHAFTASQIFDVSIEQVTPEQRYQAKAVNFGLMYGQQAFGLSQELGVDIKTAANFIQTYFKRYKKIQLLFEEKKEFVRRTGRAITLHGRERLIPEMNSQNTMIRSMAERLAVNTPIQGTQADLIKLAMLEIDRQLKIRKCRAFMILQIHDELLFEVPNEELEEIKTLVQEAMMNVASLKVPLVVDISIGKNWKEC